MKLLDYLKSVGAAPSPWAVKHGFAIPTITRFIQGKRGLSAKTIQRIEKITGGQVRMDDLLPPLPPCEINPDTADILPKAVEGR